MIYVFQDAEQYDIMLNPDIKLELLTATFKMDVTNQESLDIMQGLQQITKHSHDTRITW